MNRILVLVGAFAVLGAASAVAQDDAGLKRAAEAGGVTVIVTPVNLEDVAAPTIDFQVIMDTHSYNLAFDMTSIASLRSEKGNEESASAWSGGKGGHHVSGRLSFPAGPLRAEGSLTLTMKGVGGGKDISFTWKGAGKVSTGGTLVRVEKGSYMNVTPAELNQMLKGKDFFFINVHVLYEGEIAPTDAFIPYDQTIARIKAYPADRTAKIVVYCRSGRMSDIAARELVKAGYTNVFNLEGGMSAWEKAGLSIATMGGKK